MGPWETNCSRIVILALRARLRSLHLIVFCLFWFWWWYCDLNSGLRLSHTSSPFGSDYFGDRVHFLSKPVWPQLSYFMLPTLTCMTGYALPCSASSVETGSGKLFPGLAWNPDPLEFTLLWSWNDRHEPLHPAIRWDGLLNFLLLLDLNHSPSHLSLPSR
jgi:hypothetical protein